MKDDTVKRVYSDRMVTRLGESIHEDRRIKDSRMEDSLQCLRNFKEKAEEFGVQKIIAVGTAALREALNAGIFLELAKKEAGIDIRVISPEEEALLTIEGIKAGLSLPEEFVAFDMGGGSTEFIISTEGNIEPLSIPLGVLKLSGLFRTYPPSREEISGVCNVIKEILSSTPGLKKIQSSKSKPLIGTGGTATTISAVDLSLETYIPEMVHGHSITFNRLAELVDKLSQLTLEEIRELKGMEKGREDIILPGLLGVMEVMRYLSIEELIISDYGILEGIIKKEAES